MKNTISRTIKTTKVTASMYIADTDEITKQDFVLVDTLDDEAKIIKAITKQCDPALKPVKVVSIAHSEDTLEMPLSQFVELATVVE